MFISFKINSSVNFERIFKCNISLSKLALPEYNKTYMSATAFTVFALYKIKKAQVFYGIPGI